MLAAKFLEENLIKEEDYQIGTVGYSVIAMTFSDLTTVCKNQDYDNCKLFATKIIIGKSFDNKWLNLSLWSHNINYISLDSKLSVSHVEKIYKTKRAALLAKLYEFMDIEYKGYNDSLASQKKILEGNTKIIDNMIQSVSQEM